MNTSELFSIIQTSLANDNIQSASSLVISIALSAIFGLITAFHYVKFSRSFTCKDQYFRVIPIISIATTVIICFIKSSLTLSLGLVGALSIVRFRAPVKDPEDLAYVFIAIAIGIGMATGLHMVASVAIFCLLLLLTVINFSDFKFNKKKSSHFFSIQLKEENQNADLQRLKSIFSSFATSFEIKRIVIEKGVVDILVSANLSSTLNMDQAIKEIKDIYNPVSSMVITTTNDLALWE